MKTKLKTLSVKVLIGFSLFGLGCGCTTTTVEQITPTTQLAASADATPSNTAQPPPTATDTIADTATPSPTPLPLASPTETATPTPTIVRPDFIVGNFAFGGNTDIDIVRSLIQTDTGWEVVDFALPDNTPFLLDVSDYQPETGKILYWDWPRDQWQTRLHGAGPGNLAVKPLFELTVTTGEAVTLLPDNVVYASWLPANQGYAYILATEETYELHWQPTTGEGKILAVDVPRRFSVAPNGRSLAFTRLTDYEVPGTPGVYLVDTATGEETALFQEDLRYGALHWTANSEQIFISHGHSAASSDHLWLAADGSFTHQLTAAALSDAISEAVLIPKPSLGWSMNESFHDLRPRIFFDNNIAVGIFSRFLDELGDFSSPWLTHLATFRLDPIIGTAELVAFQPVPDNILFLGWVKAGETVMLFDMVTNTPLEIDIFAPSDAIQP